MRANDAVVGAILIVIAAAVLAYTGTFPAFPGQQYGPSLFPRILSTGLMLCGALLVLRGLAARRAGEPLVTLAPWTAEPRRRLSFLAVLGAIVFYILAAESVGFILVAFVMLAALFAWFGVRLVAALPLAAGMTFLIHYFFANLMRVPLPRGLLNTVL